MSYVEAFLCGLLGGSIIGCMIGIFGEVVCNDNLQIDLDRVIGYTINGGIICSMVELYNFTCVCDE